MKDEIKRKILIFSTAYYPFVGGAEIAVKEITDRISDVKFDLITVRFNSSLPKVEEIGNVKVFRLGFGIPILDKLLLPFWGAFFALYLNKKNHYDFFWCIMVSFASGSAYIANFIHFWKKVPIILTLQEGDSEGHFKNRWLGLINLSWCLALKRTKVLTVLSLYLAERAKKFGYRGKIEVIPNGVDLSVFKNNFSETELQEEKTKLGFDKNDKIIITTSRLVEKNGIKYLISSMKYLPEDFKLLIIGEGPLKEDLERLVLELELIGRVKFLGFVLHKELPKFLALSFAFARPSLSEGFGNSFIEAMAVKVPVFATNVGGIKDFLKDKETGILVKIKDEKSIAEAILLLSEDFVLKEKITENALKMVQERYNFDLISKKMERIFLGKDNIF